MRSKAAAAMNWEVLAATSHFQTAVAIREKVQQQDDGEAMNGLKELIDALARADKRALESYLIRIMQHVITWKMQPERHSRSWLQTIRNGRKEIRKLQIQGIRADHPHAVSRSAGARSDREIVMGQNNPTQFRKALDRLLTELPNKNCDTMAQAVPRGGRAAVARVPHQHAMGRGGPRPAAIAEDCRRGHVGRGGVGAG